MKKKTSLSLDEDLLQQFKKVASANRRSVSSEIESLMEKAIKKNGFNPTHNGPDQNDPGPASRAKQG